MTGTRRDDQGGDGLNYLGEDGGTLPLEGGEAGPRVVSAVERTEANIYRVVRKTGDIDNYTGWRLGNWVPCEEVQVPGEAYDIGESIDVGKANIITWFINYVPPSGEEVPTTSYVLSCIMEVSCGGSRFVPYTMLDNTFTQLNLDGNALQPEPVGVGTIYATRSLYAAEFRSPNMLSGDVPAAPYTIDRRIDQPVFDLDATAPPNPPAELPQVYPIGFHLTFDVAPFTAVRLRWRHIRVDDAGTFVADGAVSSADPRDPALNGFVTITYGLVTG